MCMYYIVGLGNPEKKYEHTPHNIGWNILSVLERESSLGFNTWEKNGQAMWSRGMVDSHVVELVKPLTYMNKSGEVVRMFDSIDPEQIVVVYDDIDLPFGTIKISRNKGSGGHNGIKSMEQHLKTRSFVRVRIGVCPTDWFGNPRKPRSSSGVQNYLVGRALSPRHQKQYSDIATRVEQIIISLVKNGYERTVSQLGNTRGT